MSKKLFFVGFVIGVISTSILAFLATKNIANIGFPGNNGDGSFIFVTTSGTKTARPLADRFKDHYNLADLGAKLDNSDLDKKNIQEIYNILPNGVTVDIPSWSRWDGIINSPNPNKRITWNFVNNIVGTYKPPAGDGDVSVAYQYGFKVQERDINNNSFVGYPVYFEYWNDNPKYNSVWDRNYTQYAPQHNYAISGPNSSGNTSPLQLTMDSYGQHPAGSYDVGIPLSINKYGQNSTWGFVDNLNDFSGRSPGAFAQWNEYDMSANGSDIKYWDPKYGMPEGGHRSAFYVSANTLDVPRWTADSTVVVSDTKPGSLPKPQKILVLSQDGIQYIWLANKSGITGYKEPKFPQPTKIVGGVKGNILTVTSIASGTILVGDYLTGASPIIPVEITNQIQGEKGRIGIYTLASAPGDINSGEAMYSVAHVKDNTVVWEFGEEYNTTVSSGLWFTGNTGAWDTLMGGGGTTVTGAALDTELLSLNSRTKAAAIRMSMDQGIDFTGNATMAGRNLHTLTYSSYGEGLTYMAKDNVGFIVHDDGAMLLGGDMHIGSSKNEASLNVGGKGSVRSIIKMHSSRSNNDYDVQVDSVGGSVEGNGRGRLKIDAYSGVQVSGPILLHNMTKAEILSYPNPVEGMEFYDLSDHAQVTYRCPVEMECGWYPVQYGKNILK